MTSVLNDGDVRERIRRYVDLKFLGPRSTVTLRDEDWLMKKGIVDSMGAIELMRFLEAEFAIEIGDEDVTEENLGSVSALTRFVISKRAPSATD